MAEGDGRFPGYDVLAKRDTPSWNDATREVIDKRLALAPDHHVFFNGVEWATLRALCARIAPQPGDRPPVPVEAMIDEKMQKDTRDGFRTAGMPPQREAWRIGLAAIEDEARRRHGEGFGALDPARQDALIEAIRQGTVESPAWAGLPPKLFFIHRIVHDILGAYYAHPTAWSEIGFGGPASPRGYVRMGFDRRDPWEPAERKHV